MGNLQVIAVEIGATLQGDTDPLISRVSAFSNATPDSIVFIEKPGGIDAAIASGAGAIVVPLGTYASSTPLLLSANPKLAFARAARLLAEKTEASIHPTAVVGRATVGKDTSIGAGCVFADDVVLGESCTIHPRVTIYPGTTIGDRVIVHAGVVLGADGFGYVRDGAVGEYVQFPQQGSLVIEDDVEIGANTTIDRGALEETRIGRGTKIDNLVHIGHNVIVGRNVVIAAQTGISGSTVIGDGAVIGGQVGMGDHASVGPGVIVGSGAGILPHKKLSGPGEMFWGVPAKPLKTYLRELATLAKLSRRCKES